MSKPLILIVDDEPAILELIRFHLEKHSFSVLTATDGLHGLELALTQHPDLVLLDLMLPGLDGFEVCRRLQQATNIPIIMLTARQDEIDKVLGLEIGADDYITKPFSYRELLARIKAVLRRSSNLDQTMTRNNTTVITAGQLTVDPTRYKAFWANNELELTRKEFELLYLLAANPGQVFTREYLVESIWGYEYDGDTRTVDVHIRRLRAKLENSDLIETVHGIGYRLQELS